MIWQKTLAKNNPLILPVAHDVLTARLIEQAGFPAMQIGGFALVGSHRAMPDADLVHLGEMLPWIRDIVDTVTIPVMVDGSNGQNDPKIIARTMGDLSDIRRIAAVFLEDQESPKKCGHMAQKHIVAVDQGELHIKIARHELNDNIFLLARTDAYESEGIHGTLFRCQKYLEAGANGLYAEGLTNEDEISKFGKEFKGVPLAISILEGQGKTPWLSPQALSDMGISMVLYPTSLLFRSLRGMMDGLEDLKHGEGTPAERGLTMEEYAKLVSLEYWQSFEK